MYNHFDYIDNFTIIYGISLDNQSPKVEQFIIDKVEKSHNQFVGDSVILNLVSETGDRLYLPLVQRYVNAEGDDLRHPIQKTLSNHKTWQSDDYKMYSYIVSFDRDELIDEYCMGIEEENLELNKKNCELLKQIEANRQKISSIRKQRLYEITDEI